jgi:anti-anti-sigma regulatory factor
MAQSDDTTAQFQSDYFELKSYSGKNCNYSVLKVIGADVVDSKNFSDIKNDYLDNWASLSDIVGTNQIVLDLSEVKEIKYEGLRMIETFNRLYRANCGYDLTLVGCQPPVKKLLNISHLEKALNVLDVGDL